MNRYASLTLILSACLFLPVNSISAVTNVAESNNAVVKKETKTYGHVNDITNMYLSNDGSLVLTCDQQENNLLWELKTGRFIREVGKPDNFRIPVVTASFSPDSKQIIWARTSKVMPVLFDAESGRKIGVLSSKDKGHSASIQSIVYSADGRLIATGDSQGVVVIWNRVDRSVIKRFKAHDGAIRQLLFISGRSELVSTGSDGAMKIMSAAGNDTMTTLLPPSDNQVTALTQSIDGQFLYSAMGDMTVKSWSVALRNLRGTLAFNNRQINSIAISPDNDYLAVAEEDDSIMLWSIRGGKAAWKIMLDKSVTKLIFSNDGKSIYSAGGDNWVREWDTASGHLNRKFAGAGN